jgi:integrase
MPIGLISLFGPLTDQASSVIRSLPFDADTKPDDRLFSRVTPAQVSMSFQRVCRSVAMRDCHFHDLRHSFATRLRERGVPLDIIATALGHRTLAITRRYCRPGTAQVRDAVRSLGSFLSEGNRQ